MRGVAIKLENVGIAVRDLEAAIAFFTDLGLEVVGRDTVQWRVDRHRGRARRQPRPHRDAPHTGRPGVLELFEYVHPEAIEATPTPPNQIGMHRVAFSVDDLDEALAIAARHGCHPLRGVATYGDVYRLTYLRGPSDIIVMLAEELQKG